MDMELKTKTCPNCKETKIAILCFSLTARMCKECSKKYYDSKRSRGVDTISRAWRGKSWGSKNTEIGQAVGATEFLSRNPPKKLDYSDSIVFKLGGQYGHSPKHQNFN